MNQRTLSAVLRQSIDNHADRVFCIERKRFRRTEWTYAELDRTADRIARFLQDSGAHKGDKIGICAQNGPWWLAVFMACIRSGLALVPIDVNSAEPFVEKVAATTDMKVLFKTVYKPVEHLSVPTIALEQLVEILPDWEPFKAVPVAPDDTLEIVFTSGSTGDPKGVVLSHANVVANLKALQKAWTVGRQHRLLSMIPLSHMFEQTVGFLVPFAAGSQVVYVQSIRPFQVIQALQTEHITTIVTVPAFLSLLRRRIVEQATAHHFLKPLQTELRLARYLPMAARRYMFQAILMQLGPDLRLVAVGGASLPAQLEEFWESLGVRIVQGYGLTETSPIATYSAPKNKRFGSVGRCLPGQQVRLGSDNEILLAGDNVFGGYFNNPEETAKVLHGGWYHTGDIGRFDKHGYLYITGRKKNMLLSESGLNVYPEDIETALANYPAIRDSVVMLYPVEGKDVLTAVVLSDAPPDRLAGIIREANTTLASHQTIQHTIVWPDADFPRTPTRKIKRQEVLQSVLDHAAAENKPAAQDSQPASQLQLLVANVAGQPSADIKATSNLVSDLGFDSMKRLELVSKIEEELGAYIDESAINASTTFAGLEELVANATQTPRARLFNFSFFESYPITLLRLIAELPLLAVTIVFQKLQTDPLPVSDEPVVYVANHTSHFDALTLLRLLRLRQRRTILIGAAKDYFFRSRLQSILLRLFVPLVPIDRDGNVQHTLQQIGSYLDAGFSIVLFPEGTRSTNGAILPFKAGVGVIAQELGAVIVPVKLEGNDTILPKGRFWPKRGTTRVRVGEPAVFGADGNYRQTTDEIQKMVQNL